VESCVVLCAAFVSLCAVACAFQSCTACAALLCTESEWLFGIESRVEFQVEFRLRCLTSGSHPTDGRSQNSETRYQKSELPEPQAASREPLAACREWRGMAGGMLSRGRDLSELTSHSRTLIIRPCEARTKEST
jgi:hypothetical protein